MSLIELFVCFQILNLALFFTEYHFFEKMTKKASYFQKVKLYTFLFIPSIVITSLSINPI